MRFFTLAALLIFCFNAFSQSCPPNIDFEDGDLSNWDCFVGDTYVLSGKNIITLSSSQPVSDRHQIMSLSAGAVDPYGQFPTVCPYGGNYSVKLGNNRVNHEAEGLSYTFMVPSNIDTFTMTYFYAVVFQDPNHSVYEQPRFFVTAYDVLSGEVINCASYDYVSNGSIPGFQVSAVQKDVLFKNWSPVSIQFVGLANRQVRLEFKTADCTLGGHFGYAYVDVGSGCENILATAPYCIETNSLILNAPYGFQYYTWYDDNFKNVIGNTQSIVLSPPPSTEGFFHVDMIPYPGYGCRDTVKAKVEPLPVPDTPAAQSFYSYCQNSFAQVLTAQASPKCDLLWYTTATGGIGSALPPPVSTVKAGVFDFWVSQKVLFGCESLRKKITVEVVPNPKSSFSINQNKQCLTGNNFIFTNTSTSLNNANFAWDFGDNNQNNDTSTSHVYSGFGNFTAKLTVVNMPGNCTSAITTTISVVPKPVASFTYPTVLCEKQSLFSLTDKSSVPNNLSTIKNWDWLIDGKNFTGKQPAPYMPVSYAVIHVKLWVTTPEGCVSDTASESLTVHYQPNALFNFKNTLFCDNEILQFNNLSSLPAAATGESIIKWNWIIDKVGLGVNVEHPSLLLPSGKHTVSLQTETNFGCLSPKKDTILDIHPKPHISLSITDSCVFRNIIFSAGDIDGNVDKWRWNFGSGLFNNGPVYTRTFNKEGQLTITLLGYTFHGCKDTIIRPYTVFDNKAFAGRDTLVAIDQPVQLNAHGGPNNNYTWSPATGLDNAFIENPVATWHLDQLYYLDAITDKGCDAHSKIFIKRYVGPELYIPNAFTPNKDGKNDRLRVFPVGIKQFLYFEVYDRYGQRIFKTTDYNEGWDGTIKNIPAPAGNFVAVAKAIDYKGAPMLKSVNVILIR